MVTAALNRLLRDARVLNRLARDDGMRTSQTRSKRSNKERVPLEDLPYGGPFAQRRAPLGRAHGTRVARSWREARAE